MGFRYMRGFRIFLKVVKTMRKKIFLKSYRHFSAFLIIYIVSEQNKIDLLFIQKSKQ